MIAFILVVLVLVVLAVGLLWMAVWIVGLALGDIAKDVWDGLK